MSWRKSEWRKKTKHQPGVACHSIIDSDGTSAGETIVGIVNRITDWTLLDLRASMGRGPHVAANLCEQLAGKGSREDINSTKQVTIQASSRKPHAHATAFPNLMEKVAIDREHDQ